MAETTVEPLTIRKVADQSEGTRVTHFDPVTGERLLINPDTNAVEPWPLAGVKIVGDTPRSTRVPTTWVAKAKAEGWLTLEGEDIVHRPGGSAENRWGTTHTFVHADAVVLHTLDGDVRYKVVHQPDKYADNSTVENDGKKGEDGLVHGTENTLSSETKVTDEHYLNGETRIDWFYGLELED
jgi:hypothetical protein